MEESQKPQLNETFEWEPMPDGCLLFSQETGQVLSVNPTAELILSFCDGENSIEEIYDNVTQTLSLPCAKARQPQLHRILGVARIRLGCLGKPLHGFGRLVEAQTALPDHAPQFTTGVNRRNRQRGRFLAKACFKSL